MGHKGSAERLPLSVRSLYWRRFREEALIWLEGFFGQIHVERSQLSRIGDIILSTGSTTSAAASSPARGQLGITPSARSGCGG
jgi:hypothetical protein